MIFVYHKITQPQTQCASSWTYGNSDIQWQKYLQLSSECRCTNVPWSTQEADCSTLMDHTHQSSYCHISSLVMGQRAVWCWWIADDRNRYCNSVRRSVTSDSHLNGFRYWNLVHIIEQSHVSSYLRPNFMAVSSGLTPNECIKEELQ